MGSLIVADDEYLNLTESYKSLCEQSEDLLESYLGILGELCQSNLSDGQWFTNLQAFTSAAMVLRGGFDTAMSDVSSELEGYITEIDAKDQYLYGE
ncbi:MAG: hypothetical protein LBG68_00520 [Coriobacteriales bacterium]|jgi:hypothetical protein|nr:hypothetical protein [Coriobacteriales bacterium]